MLRLGFLNRWLGSRIFSTAVDLDLQQCFARSKKLIEKAGAHIIKAAMEKIEFQSKKRQQDLLTKTDVEVERMLISGLEQLFPEHKFISEEQERPAKGYQLTPAPTWIIDPIDGTMNFAHGFPYYCISVALFVECKPAIAIVHNPLLKQTYTAICGQGAYLNGKPIHVSKKKSIGEALIINEFNSCNLDPPELEITLFNSSKLMDSAQAMRCTGSAATDLSLVAQGVADAYYEFTPHIWDIAAGSLIVSEAGGVLMDPCGGEVDYMSRRLLAAATPELAEQLSKLLGDKQIYHERDDMPTKEKPTEKKPTKK